MLAGYAVAIGVALAALAIAGPLQLRPWIEAIPVRSVLELVAVSSVAKYLLGAMVAWLVVAYLVAPVAAWLGAYDRANGLLVTAICLPASAVIGAALSLAWAKPLRELPFTMASSACLVLAVCLGFALGARLPLVVSLRGENAT